MPASGGESYAAAGVASVLKRCVKLAISMLWFAADSVGNVVRRAAGRPVPGRAVLLYYHEIRPEHRARFGRQMDTLLRWAKPVHAGSRSVLAADTLVAGVTFDDGLLSFAESALPELEKRGIPSTLFVVADRLGAYPDWPAFIPDPNFTEPMLTAEQLRELPTGLVTIGSHTLTHPTMTDLDEVEARRQLLESRIRLEQILGRSIGMFSFPNGAFNERLVDWCRDAGYDRVFTILPRLAFSDPHEYLVGRVSTEPTDWPVEFRLKLSGAYRWLPMAFELKRSIRALGGLRNVAPLRQNAA
jgi:peptidoglycan/xylan/chitin deacetylase (PgdA/CDA1 family)